MFLGEYQIAFSGHNRLVLPKKFREELTDNNEIVLSRGLDGCVWGFDKQAWQRESEKQLNFPVTEKKGRDLRRYLFSAAENVRLDEQGRFVISSKLTEYANLQKEIVIIGAGDHFEVWNKISWQNLLKEIVKSEEK